MLMLRMSLEQAHDLALYFQQEDAHVSVVEAFQMFLCGWPVQDSVCSGDSKFPKLFVRVLHSIVPVSEMCA